MVSAYGKALAALPRQHMGEAEQPEALECTAQHAACENRKQDPDAKGSTGAAVHPHLNHVTSIAHLSVLVNAATC